MVWCKDEARETLYRIAILLLSLAGLAEQAIHAPRSRRRLALAFIYRAEPVALGLLLDMVCQPNIDDPHIDSGPNPLDGTGLAALNDVDDSTETVVMLAARLRFLGLAIAHLAIRSTGEAANGEMQTTPRRQWLGHSMPSPEFARGAIQVPYIDTS